MKQFFGLIFFLLFTSLSFSQNQFFSIYSDSVALRKDNDALISDFEERVRKIDKTIDLKGITTVIENNSPTGYYLDRTNRIYLPWWETMPAMFKDFGAKVTGSKEKGEELARLFYYGFFLPHEVAHGLQFNAKKRFDNEYDNEFEANMLAVLYWREKGKQSELEACYNIAKTVLINLPNPIPAGQDKKSYFTAHYEEFTQDPNKYGYIMFAQIVDAFEDTTFKSFDDYIRHFLSR